MEKYYSTHSTSERERLLTFKKKTTLLKYLELKTGFASELLLPVNTGEPWFPFLTCSLFFTESLQVSVCEGQLVDSDRAIMKDKTHRFVVSFAGQLSS